MPLVFISVELRGKPSLQIYEKLDTHMEKNYWYRMKDGRRLPHAMYQGFTDRNLGALSSTIRADIQTNIWRDSVVFIVASDAWAMDPP
jgi:hypothetical protein